MYKSASIQQVHWQAYTDQNSVQYMYNIKLLQSSEVKYKKYKTQLYYSKPILTE